MQRAIIISAFLVLAGLGAATGVNAEVAVQTDATGDYVSTVLVPGGPQWNPGIWSPRARAGLRRGSAVLNPLGDRLGDLIPTVAENRVAPNYPWAVWSRFNGRDYDLVWASWDRAWSRVSPVLRGDSPGDDLDPSLAFSENGRPMVAWWTRNEEGRGTVWFSMFLAEGWMTPVKVSRDLFGGRRPELYAGDGRIEVVYESSEGGLHLSTTLRITEPTTITDDIDPQGFISLTNHGVSKQPPPKE